MSQKSLSPGRRSPGYAMPVIVSGTSDQPPSGEKSPVEMSGPKDFIMEYTDIFEPSKAGGKVVLNLSEEDAVSSSSDTEIVGHSEEGTSYDNNGDIKSPDSTSSKETDSPDEEIIEEFYEIHEEITEEIIIEDPNEQANNNKDDDEEHEKDKNITKENDTHIEISTETKNTEVENNHSSDIPLPSNSQDISKEEENIPKIPEKIPPAETQVIPKEPVHKIVKTTQDFNDTKENTGHLFVNHTQETPAEKNSENTNMVNEVSPVEKLVIENVSPERKETVSKLESPIVPEVQTSHCEMGTQSEDVCTSTETIPEDNKQADDSKQHDKTVATEVQEVKPKRVSIAVGTDDLDMEEDIRKLTLSSVEPKGSKSQNVPISPDVQIVKKVPEHSQKSKPQTGTDPKAKLATNRPKKKEPSRERKPVVNGTKGSSRRRQDTRGVWLCKDNEIHKLIAQKAALLKEYSSQQEKQKEKGRSLDQVDNLPEIGFGGSKQTRLRQTKSVGDVSLMSSSSSKRKNRPVSLQARYGMSSSDEEDEDERTNRVAEKKSPGKSGTFSVGLAARKHLPPNSILMGDDDDDGSQADDEQVEFCEYCAEAHPTAQTRRPIQRNEHEADQAAWDGPHHPRNLLMGIVYSAKYLGSSQIVSPQSPNKAVRMQQAQEAVGRIKVPEGEEQPTTDVDMFISTERIKVVNADSKEVLMDHALRTVSFIADIGDIVVLMARKLPSEKEMKFKWDGDFKKTFGAEDENKKTLNITCHVFQTEEAQIVAKSIGQAFNVAYQEFLRCNGLNEDAVEEAEYNGVLESQKILGEDLSILADETKAKEMVIHKKKGDILGVMIVESGWGSMVPTVIIAHMDKAGPAAKCGQLNVGDQVLSVDGTSLVGLPLSDCQNILRNTRYNSEVKMKYVHCPPVVQVVVNRPDTKYQLGFSVQNGMICSLMRGSIAERGGVRVGHRIIEINGESVVATSHQKIVELLATTIGEIHMKTMSAAIYRILVGLDQPIYI